MYIYIYIIYLYRYTYQKQDICYSTSYISLFGYICSYVHILNYP